MRLNFLGIVTLVAAAFIPTIAAADIVNVDFSGQRFAQGPELPGATFLGPGAAGGGNIFNPLITNSNTGVANDDNLTITGLNFLTSTGMPTQVGVSSVAK